MLDPSYPPALGINSILDSNAPVWLMAPDANKVEIKPVTAGCGCSSVCNALNDFDEESDFI